MKINFLKFKTTYFIFFGLLGLASIVCLSIFGLKPGIDFTGGSILEISYSDSRPSNEEIKATLNGVDLGEVSVQPSGEKEVILRMKDISEDVHQTVLEKLSSLSGIPQDAGKEKNNLEERRFESIGPVIGKELKDKTKIIVILSILGIALYIAFAFQKISFPMPSWNYGIVSLLTLVYDILIPLGVFSIMGHFYGTQVTIPVVVALLTVLGYSINNTVVVFDRIRENILKKGQGIVFRDIVNASLNQTLSRTINTSLTVLIVLISIFILGGETLRYFSLSLMIGITTGIFSSILLASPILETWLNWKRRKKGIS